MVFCLNSLEKYFFTQYGEEKSDRYFILSKKGLCQKTELGLYIMLVI
jgi:hypothetical protein